MENPDEARKVQWGPCCFCGNDILANSVDPCSVEVKTSRGKWQLWVCHAACFKERLTDPPGYPKGFLGPQHF